VPALAPASVDDTASASSGSRLQPEVVVRPVGAKRKCDIFSGLDLC
jgi:hypothetical protein